MNDIDNENRRKLRAILVKDFEKSSYNGIVMVETDKLFQTSEEIPEIPEGIELPSSEGSKIPDVETPEEINYGE